MPISTRLLNGDLVVLISLEFLMSVFNGMNCVHVYVYYFLLEFQEKM